MRFYLAKGVEEGTVLRVGLGETIKQNMVGHLYIDAVTVYGHWLDGSSYSGSFLRIVFFSSFCIPQVTED